MSLEPTSKSIYNPSTQLDGNDCVNVYDEQGNAYKATIQTITKKGVINGASDSYYSTNGFVIGTLYKDYPFYARIQAQYQNQLLCDSVIFGALNSSDINNPNSVNVFEQANSSSLYEISIFRSSNNNNNIYYLKLHFGNLLPYVECDVNGFRTFLDKPQIPSSIVSVFNKTAEYAQRPEVKGSAYNPVYVDSNRKFQQCSFSIITDSSSATSDNTLSFTD